MNVPPVWFPTKLLVGLSEDASGEEFEGIVDQLRGGAHGIGPCKVKYSHFILASYNYLWRGDNYQSPRPYMEE